MRATFDTFVQMAPATVLKRLVHLALVVSTLLLHSQHLQKSLLVAPQSCTTHVHGQHEELSCCLGFLSHGCHLSRRLAPQSPYRRCTNVSEREAPLLPMGITPLNTGGPPMYLVSMVAAAIPRFSPGSSTLLRCHDGVNGDVRSLLLANSETTQGILEPTSTVVQ